MVYCIICGQRIYQKAQYFFNRFYTVKKFGVTPHCFYRDSLTLKLKNKKLKKTYMLLTYLISWTAVEINQVALLISL